MSSTIKINNVTNSQTLGISSIKNIKMYNSKTTIPTPTTISIASAATAPTTPPYIPYFAATVVGTSSPGDYSVNSSCAIMSPPLSANSAQQHFRAPHCDLKSSFNCNDFSAADTHFSDFSLSYVAETPSSAYSDCTDRKSQRSSMTFYDNHGVTTADGAYNMQFNKEDVFRFEPEDIARLTESCNFVESLGGETSQTTMSFTPQTPYTPVSASYTPFTHIYQSTGSYTPSCQQQLPTARTCEQSQQPLLQTADCLNLDIEYFNYDEINCQSKNQSPCSSPPLDPWISHNISAAMTVQSQQHNSPKLDNTYIEYKQYCPQQQHTIKQETQESWFSVQTNPATIKLPSMMSTFGTPKYEPINSCAAERYNEQQHIYSPPEEQQQQSQPQPQQKELHYENSVNYDHLPENYQNSNLLLTEKPNREHKIIWTIDELDEINDEILGELYYNEEPQKQVQQQPNYANSNIDDINTDEDEENMFDYVADDEIDDLNADDCDDNDNDYDDDDDSVFLTAAERLTTYPHTSKALNNHLRRRFSSQSSCLTSNFSFSHANCITVVDSSSSDNSAIHPQKESSLQSPLLHEPPVCLWSDCNEVFSNQAEFVAHIEKRHVDVKKGEDFSCFWLNCPRRYKPFNARYKLLIHMRVHSGEKPNKCPFPSCNKAFSRLENLKIHQRSHTGERPYGCQYKGCLKAFSNSSDRAKHQRTHYDTKPYACQLPGCTKRYTDPSSLRKHVKNHALRNANGHLGRRKSTSVNTKKNVNNTTTTAKVRRHSESSIASALPTTAKSMISNSALISHMQNQQQQHQHQQYRQQRSNSCSEKPEIAANNHYENAEKSMTTKMDICDSNMPSISNLSVTNIDNSRNNNNTNNTRSGGCSSSKNSMNFNELSNCIVTIEHDQNENSIDDNDSTDSKISTATAETTYATMLATLDTDDGSNSDNQLNELEQLLTHKTTLSSTASADARANFNFTSTCTSNSNSTTTSTPTTITKTTTTSTTTRTTTPAAMQSQSQSQSESNCNNGAAHVDITNAANAISSNNSPEFVSFEYVKKLLAETFDYIGDSNQNVAATATAVISMDKQQSLAAAANAVVDVVVVDADAAATTTTTTDPAAANSHDNAADFANNFDMDYLSSFM